MRDMKRSFIDELPCAVCISECEKAVAAAPSSPRYSAQGESGKRFGVLRALITPLNN